LKLSKKGREVLYVTNGVETDISGKVDIVLSPKFYWIGKGEFRVKKEKEALKYAYSIFEGKIPSFENISFLVVKEDDGKFIYIAYNIFSILEQLAELGISEKSIGNIYTAQTEFQIEEPISVDSNRDIVKIDGIVSEVPNFSKIDREIVVSNFLTENQRTKYSLKFKGVGEEKGKLFKIASLIPIFLSLSFGLDIWQVSKAKEELEKEIEEKREKFDLPNTSFQIESIKKRYLAIQKEQKNLREKIAWLKNEKFYKYGKISELELSPSKFYFKLEMERDSFGNSIKTAIQKKSKNAEISGNGDVLEVKF
jgi:hypothetical protein